MSVTALHEGCRHVVREFYSLRSIGSRILRNTVAVGLRNLPITLANFGWRRDYFRDLGIGSERVGER